VPLCKAQIDWSTVNLSPNLYGKGGSLDIADATADFKNSIVRENDPEERDWYSLTASENDTFPIVRW
jgi:hypothetical protein